MHANQDMAHTGQVANSNFSSLMQKQLNQKYNVKTKNSNQGE